MLWLPVLGAILLWLPAGSVAARVMSPSARALSSLHDKDHGICLHMYSYCVNLPGSQIYEKCQDTISRTTILQEHNNKQVIII